MTFLNFYLSFFIYSIIGWFWESFLCSSFELRRLFNRGFLIGPYCPIYGIGATLSFLLLKNINSKSMIFLFSAIVSCLLEYIIGYILEKIFDKKWWDYNDYAFQIHGRVCLYGLVIFGLSNVLIVKFTTPFIIFSLNRIDNKILLTIAILISIIGFIDLALTIISLKKSNSTVALIRYNIMQKADNILENAGEMTYIKDTLLKDELHIKISTFNENLKIKENRLKHYRNNFIQ